MSRDRLDAERPDHERDDEGGRRVAVVDHDPKAARADRVRVEAAQEVLRVALPDARGIRDGADAVCRDPAQLLTREVRLDLLLERRSEQDPGRLVDPDEHGLGIQVALAHVDRCSERLRLQDVPADRRRRDAEVCDVDPGRVQAGDEAALDHPAGLTGVAARDHTRAALQGGAEGSCEPDGRLRSQIDVHEAADTVLAEEPRRRARLPDQVLVDLRAGLDLLERVDPDVRQHARLGADRDLVADRRALVDVDVVTDVARAARRRRPRASCCGRCAWPRRSPFASCALARGG